jgi:hypothetical protein
VAEHYARDAAGEILPGQDDPALGALRERSHVGGLFSMAAFEHICDKYEWTIMGERFDLADEDQLRARGYDPMSADPLVVVRKSDGKCFELEVDVTATEANPVLDPENPPPMPGQTALF